MLSSTRTITYLNYLEINFLWNYCIIHPVQSVEILQNVEILQDVEYLQDVEDLEHLIEKSVLVFIVFYNLIYVFLMHALLDSKLDLILFMLW